MKRTPPFLPNPEDPESYLCNLAGCFLLAGSTVYGDPSETTPEGKARAQQFIALYLKEAAAHGFEMCDTLHALLRRNQGDARLINLATDAMNAMPNDAQKRVMEDGFQVRRDWLH